MRKLIVCLIAVLSLCLLRAQNLEGEGRTVCYKGIVELGIGATYNFNSAQTLSTLNLQPLWTVTTSHGVNYKGLFGGIGIGYNFSQRDKENMYLVFGDVRYVFVKFKLKPSVGAKAGIIYDPYWIEKVQKCGAVTASIEVYEGLRVGLEGSIFSRPARHFTANGMFVISYSYGKYI